MQLHAVVAVAAARSDHTATIARTIISNGGSRTDKCSRSGDGIYGSSDGNSGDDGSGTGDGHSDCVDGTLERTVGWTLVGAFDGSHGGQYDDADAGARH